MPRCICPALEIGLHGHRSACPLSRPNPCGEILEGDARLVLPTLEASSVALAVWSPPYHVEKDYERGDTFADWTDLLREVIALHEPLLMPGGFLAINIADILCFKDESLPRLRATTVGRQIGVTTDDVLKAKAEHPNANRDELAAILGCSEQTVDRRLNGNNARGAKSEPQTRVKIVGGLIEQMAYDAGLYLYDRRIWVKDAAWENSKWASLSYRSVDEFEYVYLFWKPGVVKVDRSRVGRGEWSEWASRAVWHIPSVRANDLHPAMYPVELPRRLIRLLTDPGDLVLDCFAGSGTTGVAALEEGRNFIGVERDPNYAATARARIDQRSLLEAA